MTDANKGCGLSVLDINVNCDVMNHIKWVRMMKERPLLVTSSSLSYSNISVSTSSKGTFVSTNSTSSIHAKKSQRCLSGRVQIVGYSLKAKENRKQVSAQRINDIAEIYNAELNERQKGNSRLTNKGLLSQFLTNNCNEDGLNRFDDTKDEVTCACIIC
jgi:hypothetical protein